MKALKNIGIVILSIIMVCLMNLFVFSYTFKDAVKGVITSTLSSDYLTSVITNDSVDFSNFTDEEDKKYYDGIKEIIKDEKTQELLDKYINKTIEGISGEDIGDIDIKSDILDLIESNRDKLKEYGFEISDEDIEQIKNSEEINNLNEEFNSIISDTRESIPESQIKTVSKLTSFLTKTFRIKCLLGILASLILIGILQWSLYKWIRVFCINSIVSGSILLVCSLGLIGILALMNLGIDISFNFMLVSGLGLLVFGIVGLIIYNILVKKFTNPVIESN